MRFLSAISKILAVLLAVGVGVPFLCLGFLGLSGRLVGTSERENFHTGNMFLVLSALTSVPLLIVCRNQRRDMAEARKEIASPTSKRTANRLIIQQRTAGINLASVGAISLIIANVCLYLWEPTHPDIRYFWRMIISITPFLLFTCIPMFVLGIILIVARRQPVD